MSMSSIETSPASNAPRITEPHSAAVFEPLSPSQPALSASAAACGIEAAMPRLFSS